MKFVFVAGILALLCCECESIRVLPRPVLNIENVTPFSITLNWTLPINELFEEFIVEIVPEQGNVADFNPKDMRRQFVNLIPGTLYTFTVRTVRDESFSDPVVIKQDTVPIKPTNLALRAFDTLILTLDGYFEDAEFTVETHGVEAKWGPPAEGKAECYHAEIEDSDGLKAIPGRDEEIDRGDQTRQFINLTPGKWYKVTVYSATCGEGFLGELRSDGISAEIFLPPAAPPLILIEEESTSAEITWEVPDGNYDDFEIINTDGTVTIHQPSVRTTLSRNVSGLEPCTQYDFELYTLMDGHRSQSGTPVSFITKPNSPAAVSVVSFTDTSMTLELSDSGGSNQGHELRLSPSGRTVTTNGSRVTFDNLTPGIRYSITTTAVCHQGETTTSRETNLIEQTTKPLPPVVSTECSYIGVNESHLPLYEQVPWNAPEYSRITLTWERPTSGTWEDFVVDYSPHSFEEGRSLPGEPLLLSGDTTSTTINVPVTGRVITVFVRSVSNNIHSEPITRSVVCGDRNGEAILRCRSHLLYWNIRITPYQEDRLLIEIPNFPIFNATVHVDGVVTTFFNHTFTILNPCSTDISAHLTVYPICPDILPFCPIIIRPICHRRGGIRRTFDACCHNKLFNTQNKVCCHKQLLSRSERRNEECCLTQWYDHTTHTCCRDGETAQDNGSC